MIRNLKALGLTLVAVLAMGAVVASAAQGAAKFTWDNGTQELTAEADTTQTFTTTSGTVHCTSAKGKASVSGTEASAVTGQGVSYQGCQETIIGGSATVDFPSTCDYKFTAENTIENKEQTVTGNAHIECTSGSITIFDPFKFCVIHVKAQSDLGGHITYHTKTDGNKKQFVTAEATVQGIDYEGTGVCTSGTDGQYTGAINIKGYNSTTHDLAHQTNVKLH